MRILHIEDEPAISTLVMLTLGDHKVSSAADVSAARALLSSSEWDLVIADWRLCGDTPEDLLRPLKGKTPIIVLSAWADGVPAVDEVADKVILKPFASDELLAAVESFA